MSDPLNNSNRILLHRYISMMLLTVLNLVTPSVRSSPTPTHTLTVKTTKEHAFFFPFSYFHFLTTNVCFLISTPLFPKPQSPPVTFPGCEYVIYQRHNMIPRGSTCFPGCVELARVHMLVSEQELTLNQ